MRKFLVTLPILSFILFSCQKEVDFLNGNGNNNTNTATLLQKLISKIGSDSSVIIFGYNSAKKVISLDIVVTSNGTTATTQEKAVRNSQGIIQKIILKSPTYQQAGFDSIVTVMYYSNNRYTSKVTTVDLGLVILKDSTVLVYDGSGKVISEVAYADIGFGSGYEISGKYDYTYTGNNIASVKNYSYDSGSSSYTLVETYTYDEYDTKISPLYMGIDAFVFNSAEFFSSNNPVKSTYTATGNPTQNYTTTYTYNSANRPVTANSTVTPAGTVTTGTYIYQ